MRDRHERDPVRHGYRDYGFHEDVQERRLVRALGALQASGGSLAPEPARVLLT